MYRTTSATEKYPRTTYDYRNHGHVNRYNYSTVDVIKLRDMVNSGARGYEEQPPHDRDGLHIL
jgi:hypothetical protein